MLAALGTKKSVDQCCSYQVEIHACAALPPFPSRAMQGALNLVLYSEQVDLQYGGGLVGGAQEQVS